uniref:Uncharacterized protein n=1 Tax=Thermodesulfovibrio aggregans TaxID=86166 RepID=A0A7C4AJG0_9BACT
MKLKYIPSISKKEIKQIHDILSDERLIKHLWIEFLLNPESVELFKPYIENLKIKNAFEDALSWYLAFTWLLPKNMVLEELHKKNEITHYKINLKIYKEKKRNFIKGLIYAGLC